MNRGSRLVEQLLGDGTVVMDTDCALSPRELQQAVSAHIPWLRSDHGLLLGEYAGRPCCIFAKNVTYLGNPHPLYKKRIQIPAGFLDLYRRGQACGIETLLWGVYTHGDVRLFCDFDLTQYVEHNLHNSSAHVYTLDLQRALKAGIVQKVDSRGNRITVFDADHIGDFFRWKFGAAPVRQPSFLQVFDDFFSHLDKDWDGIRCYDEMAADNYRNAFQPEWPGFYLEYRFEKYLAEQAGLGQDLSGVVRYAQDKRQGGIDLDLYLVREGRYADLKAHSNASGAILGNDKETVLGLLEEGSVYYVVCFHDTQRDMDHGSVVAHHWTQMQGKSNLDSYAGKMKHSVHLTGYCVLELTRDNVRYLKDFNQGHNSGPSRASRRPKIQISHRSIDNFLIHQMIF